MRIFHATLFIVSIMLFFAGVPASAQENPKLDEFSVIMQNMIDKVASIENAYSSKFAPNIARVRQSEVFNSTIKEVGDIVVQASSSSTENARLLSEIAGKTQSTDPLSMDAKPVLEELWIRSVVCMCETRGIDSATVASWVKRESSTFVADRGNFFYPEFDDSTLTPKDLVKIYFSGFGLIVLEYLDGGVEKAVDIYTNSTDLKPYFAQQLIFRGADLDTAGLPMLKAVLFDETVAPGVREAYYIVLAGKLIGPSGQFGEEIDPSDEWRSTVAEWTYSHIITPERLAARKNVPFYGVSFGTPAIAPESLLGLIGPVAEPKIADLLKSGDTMALLSGLEATRWFDISSWPQAGVELLSLAEPAMANEDMTVAVSAMSIFERDTPYSGRPYDPDKKARIQANLPAFTGLIKRALENEDINYLSSSAWSDIFMEGSMTDMLGDVIPMVVLAVNDDYSRKTSGETVALPETEIKLIAHFIGKDKKYFTDSSDAVLGFLTAELDSSSVNPFTVKTYVDYLQSAKSSGIVLSDNWTAAIIRLRAWTESTPVLIDGENLKASIDGLLE
ncbi:MAG: hypothetical protein ABIC40_07020 [bacterium]